MRLPFAFDCKTKVGKFNPSSFVQLAFHMLLIGRDLSIKSRHYVQSIVAHSKGQSKIGFSAPGPGRPLKV